MGRYDGEEYEVVKTCSAENHRWGMNGTCFICHQNREYLIQGAKNLLKLEKEGKFGKYAG